jgi:hypothetical protein
MHDIIANGNSAFLIPKTVAIPADSFFPFESPKDRRAAIPTTILVSCNLKESVTRSRDRPHGAVAFEKSNSLTWSYR